MPSTTPRRRRNAEVRSREYLTPAEVERLIAAARRVGRHGQRDATLILIAYLSINDDPNTPLDEAGVVERASAVIRRNPEAQVVVKADQGVPYGRVLLGVSLLQASGAQKYGLLSDPAGADQ